MKLSRRRFLKTSAVVSATTLSASTFASSFTPTDDMQSSDNANKALVCVFLFGGNDAYNMIVPTPGCDAYQDYKAARPIMGLPESQLSPLNLTTSNGVPLSLNNNMSSLLPLFESGDATAIINSGQLVQPTTRDDISNAKVTLPQFLMAHNQQQDLWQLGTENLGHAYGWAGRMMDMLGANGSLSPLISVNQGQKLLRYQKAQQTVVNRDGSGIYAGWKNEERLDGYFAHFTQRKYSNIYMRNYASAMSHNVSENEAIKKILANHPSHYTYSKSDLAEQLEMVSRLIKARDDMHQQRQVFFVGLEGFDTHKNQKKLHPQLLQQVSDALSDFNADMVDSGLNDQVTCVTMSDFGRRLQANASGTDHGWAGHQIVTGGAVRGNNIYGEWPQLTANSQHNYNNGRIIPTIAADQVNASLCRWLGLSEPQILSIFPNLNNFYSPYIEFI
ncbi:DUF1501 domain-containing protein [Photobacterium andalusiense]|uniref:DUF1501 domain-containing protein n=1 Tax=Photobacterium andalusiense TaxID=2204296 RepID=A0A1Y6MFP2_9GAMM|nr:DUF1501 domain-containing protein [Photobacterium andalusiense]SMY35356.1 hypothetical protein PAND9192_02029 [Photobacterium andalusiense]